MAKSQKNTQQQQDEPANDGLLPGLRIYSPFPFNGINAKGSVIAIDDTEFVRLENVMWIGSGQLALLGSTASSAFYTAPGGLTIIAKYFYNLSAIGYMIAFLSDGSAVQIRVSNGASTVVGAAATFPTSPTVPTVDVWANQWLLIGSTTAYYIWDGTNLFKPGALSPQVTLTGSGNGSYGSAPTVTITGGSGVGAAATATLDANGFITKITITNPGSGYLATDGALLKATFTGGGITNKIAQGTATIGASSVLSVTVTDGGTGYTAQPTVTFSGGGGGTQATGVATGVANSITTITVVTRGSGYTSNPTVTVSAPAGGGNTATAVANLGLNGISAVTVTDVGLGYLTTPTVIITDPTGSGTGATAIALMSGTTVASVQITNPGQNYKNAIVSFVGGNPAVASAIVTLMPNGGTNPIAATGLKVWKNRVWMVNNTYQFITAPGSVSDFAASDGGLIIQITDSYLSYQLWGLAESAGFLYQFGDSSVDVISNPLVTISASGLIATTTYTRSNIDPQVECPWPRTIQEFGPGLIFANQNGIYQLSGSRVDKISEKLDDFFQSLPSQPQLPSAAIAVFYGIKCYVVTLYVTDPLTGANRQLMFGWDGKRWAFTATQDVAVVALTTLPYANSQYVAYGDTGTAVYLCFTRASATLTKKIISKFYGGDSPYQFKQAMRFYFSSEAAGLVYTLVLHTELGDVTAGTFTYPDAAGPSSNNAYGGRLTVQGLDALGVNGRFLGWTISSTSGGGAIDYMALGYQFWSGYYS